MSSAAVVTGALRVKGIRKVSQKAVPLHNGFYDRYVITYVTWGISSEEILVSLDCCITELWHPINMDNVFKQTVQTQRMSHTYGKHSRLWSISAESLIASVLLFASGYVGFCSQTGQYFNHLDRLSEREGMVRRNRHEEH